MVYVCVCVCVGVCGWGVCVSVCVHVCVFEGSFLAPGQQFINWGMLDSASHSLPPSSACFSLSSYKTKISISVLFFQVTLTIHLLKIVKV